MTDAPPDDVAERCCRIVSLVHTATGSAALADDLRSHLIPLNRLMGGYGALDWSHHQTIDEPGTPPTFFAEARRLTRELLAALPAIPPEGLYRGGALCLPEDLEELKRGIKRVLARARRKLRDPESEVPSLAL